MQAKKKKKKKRKKNKTYSTECEAALAKPLTFIWGKIQHWSAARVNYPACPQKTWQQLPGSGAIPRVGWFLLFCFFKNAQWRYCWGPTRTEGQLMRRQQQRLTVCLHRSLPAACWPREPASGESAAGPEPPSLDRCCKLDELVPNWSEEEEKKKICEIFRLSQYVFFFLIISH